MHLSMLSTRQRGYAACILDALTDKEIARAMGVAHKTAERAVWNIKERVGARNRVHLALILKDMEAM